jgi:hypothetical protein
MSSEDLKRIPMPLTVRAYLVNNRKSGERLIAQATLSEGPGVFKEQAGVKVMTVEDEAKSKAEEESKRKAAEAEAERKAEEEAERKAAGAEGSRDPQSGRSQAGSDVSGGLDATVDPYEWMHPCLARLLPESMQSNEQLWNGTISALKAADVRSEEQLDAMSSEDLKRIPMPLTVRAYLVNNRKSGERLIDQATLSEGTERGEEKEEKTDQMKPDEAEAAATATTDTGPEKEVQNFSAAVSAKAEGLENKSVKELREMCKAQIYKNVRSVVIFFSKYTRALTFENLWKEQGPRLLVVRRQA